MLHRRSDVADPVKAAERLQVEALQRDNPGESAALFNRAGDLLLGTGDVLGAIECFGRATDSMIEADHPKGGMALCRKIIRTVPHVVRARCTLTWLVIGAGYGADVWRHASEYVLFAEFSGREGHALDHVRSMTTVAEQPDARLALGECLLQLGDDAAADQVLGDVYRERNGGPAVARRESDVWELVRVLARLGPQERPTVGMPADPR